MNIWVEYWKQVDNRNNNQAQMKEQANWVEPDPEDIKRRFFDYRKDASKFASRMFKEGYHTKIKTDVIC
mgnify:FL=1|tara:strand:+ start:353 stop:559 length:207 start_codon:yes stop_codon:yes gene_type:complete